MTQEESGNSRSSRQILYIGLAIGVSWFLISIVSYFVPWEAFRPYGLGSEDGFLPVKLLSYSFVYSGIDHVALNLLLLWGIVNISRSCLSTEAFIRIYSLGTVGGGLVFLFISSTIGEKLRLVYPDLPPMQFYGGFLGLQTMLAAFAVFRPELKAYFLGKSAVRFLTRKWGGILAIMLIVYIARDYRFFFEGTALGFYLILDFLISYGLIFWVSLEARRVRFTAILLIVPMLVLSLIWPFFFLWEVGGIDRFAFKQTLHFSTARLSYRVAALIAGVIYGVLEKRLGKHAAGAAATSESV